MYQFLFVVLTATFVSCAKETVAESKTPQGDYLIEAGTDCGKTSLDGITVLWNAGDSFSVLSSDGENSEFTLASEAGKTTGTFKGNLSGTAPYYAIYPYSKDAALSGNNLTFKLPSTQQYRHCSFGAGTNPMIATCGDLSSAISFKNLCGVLKLTLTGSCTITKIELTDRAEASLWGNASLSLDGTQGGFDQKLSVSGGSSTLTLDCGDGVVLDGISSGVDFYFVLPAGTLAGGFDVKCYNGDILLDTFGTTKQISAIKRSEIKYGNAKKIFADLGAAQSANSYIVEKAGSYKLPAVKGNSSEKIVGISSAKVVWESYGTTTAPKAGDIVNASSISYSDGFVRFETTGTPGNALIAVADDNGKILWSWHIWTPSTKVARGILSTMQSGSIMDRNLGALTTDKADPTHNGLLYQWGRKDPFPGLAQHSSGQKLAAATATFTTESSSAQTGTQEYAAANPTVFLTNTVSPKNWSAQNDNSYWGAAKTVYDPCPPGYQLPSDAVFSDLSGTYDSSNYGWTINDMWFPFSGCRWQDGSSHASTSEASLWCYSTSNTGAYRFYASTSTVKTSLLYAKAYGCGVRCVSTDAPTPKGSDQHDFFNALPQGAAVSGITLEGDIYSMSFTSGSSFTFDRNKCGHVCVSSDGYWQINGVKSQYPFAAEDYMAVDGDGMWKLNGASTGERATPANTSAGAFDIYVTNVIERARSVQVNFSDGTSLQYDKKLNWAMRVEKTSNNMYIYMGHPNSENWVRYRFYYRYKNVESATTYPNRYDNWGLGQPSRCKYDGSSFVLPTEPELFLNGESEAAVQVPDANGNNTYTGGTLHGWENILTDGSGQRLISIKVDGVKVGEKDAFSLKTASRIDIEQQTRIAIAYGDPVTDQYATIVKRWTIAEGRVTIYSEYSFTKDIQINQAMFGMFCVKRIDQTNESYAGGKGADPTRGYVTNLAWKDTDKWNVYGMNEGWDKSTHSGYNARTKSVFSSKDLTTTRVEEFGGKGWTFAMQLDSSCPRTGGGFYIGTNGNNYNKIYFDICGKRAIKSGEVLYSTVHWEIDHLTDWSQW